MIFICQEFGNLGYSKSKTNAMLPEILDENPKTKVYSDNPTMGFWGGVIVIGNILLLVYHIFFNNVKNGELRFISACLLFPIFHVFWWHWLSKLYKEGLDIDLHGFFFFIQRLLIFLMGGLLVFVGVVGAPFVLGSGAPRRGLFALSCVLGMGVSYLYYGLLMRSEIKKLNAERERARL